MPARSNLHRSEHAQLNPVALDLAAVKLSLFQIHLPEGFDQREAHGRTRFVKKV